MMLSIYLIGLTSNNLFLEKESVSELLNSFCFLFRLPLGGMERNYIMDRLAILFMPMLLRTREEYFPSRFTHNFYSSVIKQ